MKKIFTLMAGIFFAVAVMAADRKPVVKINSSKNYKIMIDGRSYFGSDMTIHLNNIYGGRHTIKVFEMRRGRFGREVLVDATTFHVGRNDVMIRIDRNGNIMVRERKNFNYRGSGNDDWNDRDGRDIRDDKGYDSKDDRNYDRRDDRDGRKDDRDNRRDNDQRDERNKRF